MEKDEGASDIQLFHTGKLFHTYQGDRVRVWFTRKYLGAYLVGSDRGRENLISPPHFQWKQKHFYLYTYLQ